MRKANGRALLSFVFFVLCSAIVGPGQKNKDPDIPQKYRHWLDYTRYIIHDKEKEVFLRLDNDRDRDVFIEAFWKQRDPTLGTPENEFKDEHARRFLYANEHFRRGSGRLGWLTDMGKIYIILGEPVSIERFDEPQEIYPTQIWSYYGDPGKHMPSHFSLVFFQRGGAGEYRLYDPVSDGPASLLIHSNDVDPFDFEEVYEKIREYAPTLALVSLSIVPGEIPFNYQPSPQNAIYMADILESRKKEISPSYATHFLDYKGIVSTEYLTNYVQSETEVALIQDPLLDLNFLHYSIVPKNMSLEQFKPKDQYYCNLRLDVSLRQGDNIILQYEREFSLYFPADEIEKVRRMGISIEDSLPVVEGQYEFIALLQNSVGKEFCLLEKNISIPERSEEPRIVGPHFGYKILDYPSNLHIPFKMVDKKLAVDPRNTFGAGEEVVVGFNVENLTEDLWKGGEVLVYIKGLSAKTPSEKSIKISLNSLTFHRVMSVFHAIPAAELVPDYYELKLRFTDKNGTSIDEKGGNFIVSPERMISHPASHSKAMSLDNKHLFYYMQAHQYERLNELERAEQSYEKAYSLNPGYKKGLIEAAQFFLKAKKFGRAQVLAEGLKEDESLRFDYYLLKGRALLGLGKYGDAIVSLLEANKVYNSDIGLLNALGFCYYKTGQERKALEALSSSLRLKPDQKEIASLIKEIEKDIP